MANTASVTLDQLNNPTNRDPKPATFAISKASDLPDADLSQRWLVENLWLHEGVGLIGAYPKKLKTWLALDLAVSVASGTPCLGQFQVSTKGPVLLYSAEDSPASLKGRVSGICQSRDLDLDGLDIHFITEARIDLRRPLDYQKLETAVRSYQPRLLILDPFVRIFSGNEDDSSQVSQVLSLLRALQRRYKSAVMVVHHNSKRAQGNAQALRGSGDFYAWMDSGLFLASIGEGAVTMTAEHRAAAAPAPVYFRLASEEPLHLEFVERDSAGDGLARKERNLPDEILEILRSSDGAVGRKALREKLCVRNEVLGDAIRELRDRGAMVAVGRKWALASSSVPDDTPGPNAERHASE